MTKETILTLIKWGPIVLFLFVFLCGLISGIKKGNRKTIRRLIYVAIYTTLITIFTPKITQFAMQVNINGMTVEGYLNDFINNNQQFKEIVDQIPGLHDVILQYPVPFASLVVYLVLMLVGLPLSFPIYFIYVGIYALISKVIFRYTRYEVDKDGNVLRNKKGKKIKKEKKFRLVAGLMQGTEAVALTSIILTPFGFVTRVYNDAQSATINNTLKDVKFVQNYKDIIDYIEAVTNGIFGKFVSNPVNKAISDYLTSVEIDGKKTTIEKEVSELAKAAVYVEQSGIIELAMNGVDLNTLDLSTLKLDKLEMAINSLFNSKTLEFIVVDGVNYLLENKSIKDTLTKYTDNAEIVSEIKYSKSNEIKNELLNVVGLLKTIIDAKILEAYQDKAHPKDVLNILNKVTSESINSVLNKVLSIEILNKLMPQFLNKILKNYGLVEELKKENNTEIVDLLMNAVDLSKTLEIVSKDDFTPTEGETMLDKVLDKLASNGTIKAETIESLAELFSKLTSSNVFDDIVVSQLNKLMGKFSINLNGQMIANVKTTQEWTNELNVFQDIYTLYEDYSKKNTVDFEVANNLLSHLADTKVMVLALPISYQMLFPKLGIETDPNNIEFIDYTKPGADKAEAKFYNDWKGELVHLQAIALELPKLNITKMEDFSLDLLKNSANIESLGKVLSEAFSMQIITTSLVSFVDSKLNEIFKQYEISFKDGTISKVNKVVENYPKYIEIDKVQYDVYKDSDNQYKYVNSEGNIIVVEDETKLLDNTLNRVWTNEIKCLSTVVTTITSTNFKTKEGVSAILNSVEDMYLLKDVQVDLLKYAVKSLGIMDEVKLNEVFAKEISFSKEKTLLVNSMEYYSTIEKVTQGLDIKTLTQEDITGLANILSNLLQSDVFSDYLASTVNDAAISSGFNYISKEMLLDDTLDATTWENDLTTIKNLVDIVSKQTFTKDDILTALTGLKSINLLKTKTANTKPDLTISNNPTYKLNTILLDMLNKVTIDGITLDTPDAEIVIYDDEVNAITKAMENSDTLINLDETSIKNLKTDTITKTIIADTLTATLKSKIFSNGVASVLNDTFIKVGVKPDSTLDLIEDIKAISNWNNELDSLINLLNIEGKETITNTLFTNIESDPLLGKCKANIMIKLLSLIPDTNILTVEELKANNYELYNKEKDIIISLANVELSPNVDVETIDASTAESVGSTLDILKESKAFANLYNKNATELMSKIKQSTLTIKDIVVNETAYKEVGFSWKVELVKLVDIIEAKDTNFNPSTFDDAAINDIGNLLDAIDNSKIFNNTKTDQIAKKAISDATGIPFKGELVKNQTGWASTIKEKIDSLTSQI